VPAFLTLDPIGDPPNWSAKRALPRRGTNTRAPHVPGSRAEEHWRRGRLSPASARGGEHARLRGPGADLRRQAQGRPCSRLGGARPARSAGLLPSFRYAAGCPISAKIVRCARFEIAAWAPIHGLVNLIIDQNLPGLKTVPSTCRPRSTTGGRHEDGPTAGS
jgi:hypothetical protein